MPDFGTDGKKEKRRGKRKTNAETAAARLGRYCREGRKSSSNVPVSSLCEK